MFAKILAVAGAICVLALLSLLAGGATVQQKNYPISKSQAEWKKQLTPEQFRVLRKKGTEPAFSGKLYKTKDAGTYSCAGCGQALFSSAAKFDSGTGWPSFWQPVSKKAVEEIVDESHGMVRTEVVCSRCGGHLGHVFDDGPKPTGLRYCMNSVSLTFKKSGGTGGKR